MHSYKNFEYKELKEYSSKKNPVVEVEEKIESSIEEFVPRVIKKSTQTEHDQQFMNVDLEKKNLKHTTGFKLNQASRDGFDLDKKEEQVLEKNIEKILNHKLETIGKDAYNKSYQDGLVLGKNEAYLKFETEAKAKLENFDLFLKEMDGVKNQIIKDNELMIVEMIFKIIKMIVLKEVSLDKEYVKRLSIDLIQKVGLKNAVKLKIASSDLESVKEILPQLNVSVEELRNLSLQASEDVQPGGVLLETDKTLIDAEIETQLKSLSESLFK